MSLDTYSRYRFCVATDDANGNKTMSDRARFTYRERADNIPHTVEEGDTLFSLAGRYYANLPYACQLWSFIGDFQVDSSGRSAPIHDPTVALTPGSIVVVPSQDTVLNEGLSTTRRQDHDRP